jgi:hypothetical protein
MRLPKEIPIGQKFLDMMKYLLFLVGLLFFAESGLGQINGCPDPQATNFNPVADTNDGTCLYGSTIMSPIVSLVLPNAVQETSGLFFYDEKYWTHNDDTEAMFFAIDSVSAEVLDTVIWDCLNNIDWEECHINGTHLIIGDIGNNTGNRTDLKFFMIPLVDFYSNDIEVVDTLNFVYEDQDSFVPSLNNHDFDGEAFLTTADSVFIFSKCWSSNVTKRYALPLIAGNHTALLRETYNVNGLITGATFFNQEQSVALCGYTSFLQPFVWLLWDYTSNGFFSGNKRRVELGLPFHQVEGIVFKADNQFYLSNERYVGALTIEQKWHEWNVTSLFQNPIVLTENQEFQAGNPYPVPTTGLFQIDMTGPHCFWRYEIYNAQGEMIKRGSHLGSRMNFDISNLSDGMYYVHIAKRETRMVKAVFKQSTH